MLRANITIQKTIQPVETEIPEPGKGEVRVRLTLTGICGSDVHLFHKGRSFDDSLSIGHEGLGFIDKAGEGVNKERKGERVVFEPNIPCNDCPECRNGRGNICRNKRIIGITENGCMSEYVIVPDEFAWKLPKDISDKGGVAIEPAAVAFSALKRSVAKPGDTILVIGLGATGLLIVRIALAIGYKVLVTEPVESKMKLASEMGAIPVDLNLQQEDMEAKLMQVCQKEEVKSIFECTGSENSASLAISVAPRGAEVVLLGLSESPATFKLMELSKKGIRINPSLIYDHPSDYRSTIELIRTGKIHPGFIVTRFFQLKEAQKALEEASKGIESKIVLRIQ